MSVMQATNYTDINAQSIVEKCVERLRRKYGSAWNDAYEDSVTMAVIEAFAYVFDHLAYYLDRQANECYLGTARDRQSLIDLCKTIGYSVQGARAAQVDLTFSISEARAEDVIIPRGFQVETAAGVIFEVSREERIFAGDTSALIGASQVETLSERLGYSTGEGGQRFALSRAGVVTIDAVAVDGTPWQKAESFIDSIAYDKHYTASLDAQGYGILSFGDGTNGAIPEQGSVIAVTYRFSLGRAGNVTAGTITKARDIISDSAGARVTVSVSNDAAATGGADPETNDHIKLWAPRYYETQNRCVTQSDYEVAAMAFSDAESGRVAKARAIVTEQTGAANVVSIYVLTYGATDGEAALPSSALKTALKAYLDEKKMLTDWIDVKDGTLQSVPVTATLKIRAGYVKADVIAAAKSALAPMMHVDTRELGESLRISDLYALLDGIEGVDYVELTTPLATVTAGESTLLTLGTVTIEVT